MADLKQEQQTEEPAIRDSLPNVAGPSDKEANLAEPAPAVRFRSTVEEISPENTTTQQAETVATKEKWSQDVGAVTADELRALSQKLQGTHLQERRMSIFQFEPYSLPVSRAPSNDDSRETSRQPTRSSGSGHPSPSLQPRTGDMVSPPLTPAGTDHADSDGKRPSRPTSSAQSPRPDVITPQESTKDDGARESGARKLVHRPASADDLPRRTKSGENRGQSVTSDHRRGLFSGGAAGSGSLPSSRDSSPSRTAASQHYSRGFTPPGEANDPYAASKRQPQGHGKIEPRFVFSRKGKAVSPSSSTVSLPKSAAHHDKRHSGVFNHRKEELMQHENSSASSIHGRTGSMSDLKRFFKLGGHHKVKRTASPAPSIKSTKSGYKTPPSSKSSVQIPFGDDHGLSSKYGKLGKVLGAGAGGSVRLMKRSEDNTVFAVKEFRPRHSYESEREYVKKLTAEYCMGSSLHHGNIIETLDIVQEKGKWYEVMEYAPFDLFAIVMTGKMSREEVSCCFLQILSGVTYLHSMGLAHRDLKLDNVVVSDRGIMKIIDFGSAHVYKYPFENGIVKASGIVGSDPYLAPEVYDDKKYDPTAVDIWSLAIIFCCMTLRRFPWKVPRLSDNSYKLFAAEPTPGHDPKKLTSATHHSASTTALSSIPARDMVPEADGDRDKTISPTTTAPDGTPITAPPEKKEVIRGPWRILRLLPRESRHVIGRMLEIKPRDRATMADILSDPWVADTVICRQPAPGEVEPADDHTHILEPPAPSK